MLIATNSLSEMPVRVTGRENKNPDLNYRPGLMVAYGSGLSEQDKFLCGREITSLQTVEVHATCESDPLHHCFV
jgi:hypothetical protein